MSEPRLSRLTAVLARGPGQPDGDSRCGIEIDLCLDARGQILPTCDSDEPWRVRRYWPDRGDWLGELVAVGDGWGVRNTGGDDDPVWELHGRLLRPGEYITLVRPTDAESAFRIVNVEALG
ncbi:MAG: hypothetical protein ACREF1_15170 [Acetobacteraceae bacterium]